MKPTVRSSAVLILGVFLVTPTLHGGEGVIGPFPWPTKALASGKVTYMYVRVMNIRF